MFQSKCFSRVASRTLRAISSHCHGQSHRLAGPAAQTLRATAAATTQSSFPTSWTHNKIFHATFSTSRQSHASNTQVATQSKVRDELVAKIESELSLEKEMRDPEAFPEHLKEFIDNSPFEINDVLGQEELTLTRKFGDETIKIAFSIDDLNNVDEDPDQLQDENAMLDELEDPAMDPQSKQPRSSAAEVDEEGVEDEEQEPSFRSHLYITVERPNKGALQIEAIAQDGMIVIENVYYYKDGKLAEPKTRADEDASRDLYTGPPFGNLDEDLQLLFEKYLEERGINTALALFVPEYIDYKEQKEYLNWLSGVKSFVQ